MEKVNDQVNINFFIPSTTIIRQLFFMIKKISIIILMKTLLHVKDLLLVFIVLTRQSKLTCILQVEHRK